MGGLNADWLKRERFYWLVNIPTKFVFIVRSENASFHVFGETLTDGLIMSYVARAS